MKDKIIDSIGNIDHDMIEKTDALRQSFKKKKKYIWIKCVAIATCFCLVISGIAISNQKNKNRIQVWNSDYSAEQYFKYSTSAENNSSSSISDLILPYAESRDFSAKRQLFEDTNIIPTIETHPIFFAKANYNSDKSLYSLELSWGRRDSEDVDNYSDLTVTTGYEEVPQINDCITIEIDESGNIIEPGVTVTKRDGICIVAVGSENQNKTITFKNDSGWYQIAGSWNDSYEDVVELFEWFWEHPIDFAKFSIDAGDRF